MKRTTIYLEPETEVLLERETRRRRVPMATLIREAIHAHLGQGPATAPPGAGAFKSGHTDTAEHAERALSELGFGESR